jgi:hypothetical protein
MTNPIRRVLWTSAVVGIHLTSTAFAAPKKTAVPAKPAPKSAAVPAKPGIKSTPQVTGAVCRFGDLFALKSGWTYQILSAKISYEPFDDYGNLYPATGQKLLVLNVAIKNNTPDDLFFGSEDHEIQVQDSNNQLYTGNNYRLASGKSNEFGPTLKPGQGAGQDLNNPLQVAIQVAEDAKIVKVILKQGRKGTSEEVIRFPIAGAPDGDPKNVISPAVGEDTKAIMKPGDFVPSRYYDFRVDDVSFITGPIKGVDPPENRRFAVVKMTVRNALSKNASSFDFLADSFDKQFFTDADGENYTASGDIGVLKASSDESFEGDFQPGQERKLRVVFPVPTQGALKSLTIGAVDGKFWNFDASGWK